MSSIDLYDAKRMIERLLLEHDYTEESLAKSLGVYPKTVRDILSLEKKRLSRKTRLALIGLYCQTDGVAT